MKAAWDIFLGKSDPRKMGICIPNYNTEHWIYSALPYWELYFLSFVSVLKVAYFPDLLGFKWNAQFIFFL